jgi:hypothetical protein
MKFPISHCLPTKYLTKEKYDWLLCKLISDGYHLPSGSDKSLMFDMWKYLGVNQYGDIHLYDNPVHYISLNEEVFNNILNEQFLEEYLNAK